MVSSTAKVQILSIIAKPQTPAVALDLIAPFEEAMSGSRDAKFLWQTLKGEKLTLSGDTEAAKELLDNLGSEIEAAYEVQALIQSHFHKTKALLWKTLRRPQEPQAQWIPSDSVVSKNNCL